MKFAEDYTKKVEEEEAKRKAAQEKEKQRVEDLNTAYQSLGDEVKNLAFDLLTASIEREKNDIQGQIDLLDQKKQKDIEVANQTIASATDRAAAITVIEARAQAEREQLEAR